MKGEESMANRAVGLMSKKEFVRNLADRLDVTQGTALLIISAVEDTILDGLAVHNKVKFGDLVCFTKQHIPAKKYRLPGDTTDYVSDPYDRIVPSMVEGKRRMNVGVARDHA